MENVTNTEQKMDLKIIENIQKFDWNFSEIKVALQERIDKYVGLVVTEQNLKDMEKTQKEIASLRIKVEGFRKQVKKELDAPYVTFETQINELKRIIADAEDPIKDQLGKYEQQRIGEVKAELLKYAAETARSIGLREENAHITILAKWTNRTAKKNEVRQDICAELERMRREQEVRDVAEALAKQKAELIEQLCVSTSELYSLSTPVTPREVAYLTYEAGIAEIPEIIKQHCKDRAEVELKAAREAEAIVEAKAVTEVQTMEAAKAAETLTKAEPLTLESAGTRQAARWNLTLEFVGLTTEQAVALCNYIKAQGLGFATLDKKKVSS